MTSLQARVKQAMQKIRKSSRVRNRKQTATGSYYLCRTADGFKTVKTLKEAEQLKAKGYEVDFVARSNRSPRWIETTRNGKAVKVFTANGMIRV